MCPQGARTGDKTWSLSHPKMTVNQERGENFAEEGPPPLREQAPQNRGTRALAAAQPAQSLAPRDRPAAQVPG